MSDARRAFAAHPLAAAIATGLGSGLSPVAPGTAGSAVGLLLAWRLARALAAHASIFGVSVGLLMSGLALGFLGVAAAGPVCRALAAKDPGCVVIDEVAGQLIASSAVPLVASRASSVLEAGAWLLSLALFRFFDIVKPGPIRRLQALPGGWGVVADDVAGGAAAAVVLYGLGRLAERLSWI